MNPNTHPSNHLYSLDFLKVMAALMITNSHFLPLYRNVSKSLATFGVQGNALFFFVSGFLLMMGFDRHSLSFANWYKRRINRLWPSVFLWGIISALVWDAPLTLGRLLLADGYWFLQSIVVNYILFYVVCKCLMRRFGGGKSYLSKVFGLSIAATLAFFVMMPKAEGSIFHTDLHFVCHFSIMIMGAMAYCRQQQVRTRKNYRDIMWMMLSFAAYFILMKAGKGQADWRYYIQILALGPLHTFVWYAYKVASCGFVGRLFQRKYCGRTLHLIASLTLEIYIVQFMVITDKLNSLFPLNVVLVFIMICIAAYLLRVVTQFFLQFLSDQEIAWKEMVRI